MHCILLQLGLLKVIPLRAHNGMVCMWRANKASICNDICLTSSEHEKEDIILRVRKARSFSNVSSKTMLRIKALVHVKVNIQV